MQFIWTTLNVKNMDESLKFYQEVIGLPLNRRFAAGPGVEIAFLGEGSAEIELISNGTGSDITVGKDISWGFEVDSLDGAMAMMGQKGVAIQGGPFQPNPHTRFFYVLDPNGMKIQIVERK